MVNLYIPASCSDFVSKEYLAPETVTTQDVFVERLSHPEYAESNQIASTCARGPAPNSLPASNPPNGELEDQVLG